LRGALAGRVVDLIEISERINTRAPDRLRGALRDSASATKDRRTMLNASVGHRPWRCVLPPEEGRLAEFLGTGLIVNPYMPQSADVLILLSSDDPKVQRGDVERHLKQSGGESRCRVVTYMVRPTLELQQYCEAERLSVPIEVRGGFELWYLLMRLNEHAVEHRPEDSYSVHPVRLAESASLQVKKRDEPPSVLVTSAFNVNEAGQWLLAANDVGELLYRVPHGFSRRTELSLPPERLKDILGNWPVSVWIHIGHGHGKSGLWVPGEGDVGAERWIQCFRGRHLRLALFLTCQSDGIARRFAEEGASVAIGFEGDVESDKSWQLAAEVVDAIVSEGAHGGAVLAGFRAGLPRFDAVRKLGARARAYYPRET